MQKDTTQKRGIKNSLRAKLMILITGMIGLPLIVSVVVSYVSSTQKSLKDAEDYLEWQAWYIEDVIEKTVNTNMSALKAFALSPSTVEYLEGEDNDDVILSYMNEMDTYLDDGNATILTGSDGMQLIRSSGDCVDISDREYFIEAMKGNAFISNIQVSRTTGARIMTFAVPVYRGSTVIGIVQRNFNLDNFHDILAAESEGKEAFIVDRDGNLAAHSDYRVGVDSEEVNVSNQPFMSSDEGYYVAKYGGAVDYVAYVREPNSGFTVAITAHKKDVTYEAMHNAIVVTIISIIMLLIAVILERRMISEIVNPIKAVDASLTELINGRFVKLNKYTYKKDEIGSIVNSLNTVMGNIGDLIGQIKLSAKQIGDSSSELSDTSEQISHTADEVSNSVQGIAAGAAQQADEIQNASANVGQIGDAVSDVKDSSENLRNLADRMKNASEVSSESLSELKESSNYMTSKIDDISDTIGATQDAVAVISEKVEGITSIATQTNLLSLNASIEAARAGDAGKGFAVVAEEIGKLAEDSKHMADDIRIEMNTLLEKAQSAVNAAEEVKDANAGQQTSLGETIEAISGMISDINDTVDGVRTISVGADQCNSSKNVVQDSMSALSAISQQNATSAETTGASMEELSATVTTLAGSAGSLKEIADKLNEEISFFTIEDVENLR